ncbi:hypothetical protein, partial [Duncaniella sp.]|uniref:hypothetical protein n=1 Tax=Duncaniella sp. TaxID=2518496 RepID=UPI0023C06033
PECQTVGVTVIHKPCAMRPDRISGPEGYGNEEKAHPAGWVRPGGGADEIRISDAGFSPRKLQSRCQFRQVS